MRFFFFFLLLVSPVWALDTPKNFNPDGLQFRLVPKSAEPIEGVGAKDISLILTGNIFQIQWTSLVRILVRSQSWPEFRVETKKGAILSQGFTHTTKMVHPHLWSEAVEQLDGSSPLWIPLSESLVSKKGMSWDHGFFSKPNVQVQGGLLRSKIDSFIQKFANSGTENDKKIKEFLENFTWIHLLKKTDQITVFVDGQKKELPVESIGNDYVVYQVLAHEGNPLILNVTYIPENAPDLFKADMQFFHDTMEFQVTQMNTSH